MAYTIGNILSKIYYLMWEKTTSTTYDMANIVLPKYNAIRKSIFKWNITDIRNQVPYKGWDLIFLRKTQTFTLKSNLSNTVEILKTDTTITLSNTTNYSTSWIVLVEWDIVTYTWKTSTQLTWCSWITVYHSTWCNIKQIFALNSDFWKPYLLEFNNSNNQYYLPYIDFRDKNKWLKYYTLIGDNINYLNIVWNDWNYYFKYYYLPTDRTTSNYNSNEIIPDEYIDMICYIVAGELLFWAEETAQWQNLLSIWYPKLIEFYKNYTETTKSINKNIRFRGVGNPFTSFLRT